METEKTKEIRKEFCSIKGWNYLEFDCLEDAEEYIIFLESKVNNVVLDAVKKCAFDCENPVFEKGASYCKMHMKIDDWS